MANSKLLIGVALILIAIFHLAGWAQIQNGPTAYPNRQVTMGGPQSPGKCLEWGTKTGTIVTSVSNAACGAGGSSGPFAAPFVTGTSLPATCTISDYFHKTNDPPGNQLYTCSATNTWTRVGYRIDTVTNITGSACTVGMTGFATNATAGQNWYFCTATNTWTQQLNTGGGGSGTTYTYGLLDWFPTKVTTTLSFGTNCLIATPCNVKNGKTPVSYVGGPYIITVANSNTGTLCAYFTNTGTLTVGYGNGLNSGDIAGSGAVAFVPATNSCPLDAEKLFTWHVTSGAFDSTPTSVVASYLDITPSPIPGYGMSVIVGNRDTINVDRGTLPTKNSCASGPGTTLPPTTSVVLDYCVDLLASPPGLYICSNASNCTVAADWKKLN